MTDVKDHRKVWGAGYKAGLLASQKEITMTPKKQQKLLEGLNSIAIKVYEHTPIETPATIPMIHTALHHSKLHIENTAIRGCLKRLREEGLVQEHPPQHYRRVAVREIKKTSGLSLVEKKTTSQEPDTMQNAKPQEQMERAGKNLTEALQAAKEAADAFQLAAMEWAEQVEKQAAKARKAEELLSAISNFNAIE